MRLDQTVLCLTCAIGGRSRGRPITCSASSASSRVIEHDGGHLDPRRGGGRRERGHAAGLRAAARRLSGTPTPSELAEAAGSGALVLRLVSGGGTAVDAGARGWEDLLEAVPELKIVSPATASDAKGLLISAIRSPDPVGFIECRDLYTAVCDGVPEGDHTVPLGEAQADHARRRDRRPGSRSGRGRRSARGRRDGSGDVRLMDLRTLRPLDDVAVLDCVRELGKVLIVEQPGARTGRRSRAHPDDRRRGRRPPRRADPRARRGRRRSSHELSCDRQGGVP